MDVIFSQDPHRMNWIRQDFPYCEVTGPEGLTAETTVRQDGDLSHTEIRVTNVTGKPILTNGQEVAISLPLEDRYEETERCLTSRGLIHLFCGGSVVWSMGLRMGGEPPHLGLIFTEGEIHAYSIRHNGPLANDRGCFLLHPPGTEWQPGETKTWRFTIFPHEGEGDFFWKLHRVPGYLQVDANQYVLFPGETTQVRVYPADKDCEVHARCLSPFYRLEEAWYGLFTAREPGEVTIPIEANGRKTWCRLIVLPPIEELAERRVHFLAEHQQYKGQNPDLQGAYLAYDNDEDVQILNGLNDYNGGRERVGMGVLMARYLSRGGKDPDGELRQSLDAYIAYVRRELVDTETGRVCNDLCMDDSYRRSYNYPWFIRFFLEVYYGTGDTEDLLLAVRILRRFYEQEDGVDFYPIEMPLVDLASALAEAGLQEEEAEVRLWAVRHADRMCQRGIHYPPFEVAFEQSIVGPAVDVILQVCELTGKQSYLKEAKKHLKILEQFNGMQPDWHLNETAIRNWDGYWFGKNRVFGDTFPHYWSAISGNCFERYARLSDDTWYFLLAEASLRGVLPLIFPDGRASCACLYPLFSNGQKAQGYDPRANDQDWGLYFYLRYLDGQKE